MRKNILWSFTVAVLGVALAGCGMIQMNVEPTITLVPTIVLTYDPTPTPADTPTPEPTPSPELPVEPTPEEAVPGADDPLVMDTPEAQLLEEPPPAQPDAYPAPGEATQVPPAAENTPVPPAAENTPVSPAQGQEPNYQADWANFFLVSLDDGGASGMPIGCNDSLVEVSMPLDPPTNTPLRTSLERMFALREQTVGDMELYNALWQSNLQVGEVSVDGSGVATVNINGTYMLGGSCDVPRFAAQIQQTVLAVEGIEQAVVLLNGVPLEQALSQQ
jgi:hypothetical protein